MDFVNPVEDIDVKVEVSPEGKYLG